MTDTRMPAIPARLPEWVSVKQAARLANREPCTTGSKRISSRPGTNGACCRCSRKPRSGWGNRHAEAARRPEPKKRKLRIGRVITGRKTVAARGKPRAAFLYPPRAPGGTRASPSAPHIFTRPGHVAVRRAPPGSVVLSDRLNYKAGGLNAPAARHPDHDLIEKLAPLRALRLGSGGRCRGERRPQPLHRVLEVERTPGLLSDSRWTIGAYAEMAGRTTVNRAFNDAGIWRMAQSGIHLVTSGARLPTPRPRWRPPRASRSTWRTLPSNASRRSPWTSLRSSASRTSSSNHERPHSPSGGWGRCVVHSASRRRARATWQGASHPAKIGP